MQQKCIKCIKDYDKYKEGYCKNCYELQILKGQCLNIAGTIVGGMMSDSTFEISQDKLPETIFTIAKRLFDEGKRQKFMEW